MLHAALGGEYDEMPCLCKCFSSFDLMRPRIDSVTNDYFAVLRHTVDYPQPVIVSSCH